MMKSYRIADLTVNMSPTGRTERLAAPYEIPFTDAPDGTIRVTQERIDAYKAKYPDAQIADWQYYLSGVLFSSLLMLQNGLVLHASAVAYKNEAFLFSADSGTGKSTHVARWQKVFPEAVVINDDKPAIRLTDEGFFVYGTPWSGKTDLNTNIKVPLKGICFLERGTQNSIVPMTDAAQIIPLFLQQTLHRNGREKTDRMLTTLDKLIRTAPFYRLTCLPNDDAARVAYAGMH